MHACMTFKFHMDGIRMWDLLSFILLYVIYCNTIMLLLLTEEPRRSRDQGWDLYSLFRAGDMPSEANDKANNFITDFLISCTCLIEGNRSS